MAGEIQAPYVTGRTLYAVLRDATGRPYNTLTPGFEAYTSANLPDYAIALAEQGASGVYVGDMPAVAAGSYAVTACDRLAGAPAESDPVAATGGVEWGGAAVLPRAGVAAAVLAAFRAWAVAAGYTWEDWVKDLAAALGGDVTTAGTVYLLPDGTPRLTVTADDQNNRTVVRS